MNCANNKTDMGEKNAFFSVFHQAAAESRMENHSMSLGTSVSPASLAWHFLIQLLPLLPELTTHAVCTASDTLPAFGSHQNTWHWKCWFPVSIIKANVCASRPTPMKDKKRTRHSMTTSSSSSC